MAIVRPTAGQRLNTDAGIAEPATSVTRVWQRPMVRSAVAVGVVVLGALLFMNPIFRGSTFSDVADHQSVTYPWTAYPSSYHDPYPQTDEAEEFYPWQVLTSRAYSHGHVPFWDPYTFAGSPFFTNGTSGVVYPVRILLSVAVSPSWAHDLFVLIHLILAGVFMFVLMRSLGVSRLAAVLAATAWMLNGYSLAWAQLEHVLVVAAFLPAGVWLVREAATRRGRRSMWAAVALGVVLALMILGGNAEYVLLAYLVIIGYGVCLGVAELLAARRGAATLRSRVSPLLRVGAAAALGPGLAAVSLLPTVLVFRDLARRPLSYSTLVQATAEPWSALLGVLIPDAALGPHAMDSIYMGLPVAFLAVVGVFQRRRGVGFARTVAAVTALVVLGTPVTWIAYHFIPGFGFFRPLGRAWLFWDFGVAILAGFGLQATVSALSRHTYKEGQKVDVGVVIGIVALVITAAQCIQFGRMINPPFQPRVSRFLYPVTPEIKTLLSEQVAVPAASPQRVLPVRLSYTPKYGSDRTPPTLASNLSSVFGIESAAGYESVLPNRTADLWRVVEGESVGHVLEAPLFGAYRPSFTSRRLRLDLLPRLGVTTLIAPPHLEKEAAWRLRSKPIRLVTTYSGRDGELLDVVDASPRAYVVHRAVAAKSARAALATFTDPAFDAAASVVVDGADAPATGGALSTPPEVARTTIGPNAESYRVDARRPGWLVVLGSWDPGWSAYVNGRRVNILHADYAFRAVRVPRGAVEVDFRYRPAGFRAGLAVTVGAAALIGLLALGIAVRSRWPRRS